LSFQNRHSQRFSIYPLFSDADNNCCLVLGVEVGVGVAPATMLGVELLLLSMSGDERSEFPEALSSELSVDDRNDRELSASSKT
jgi:hypothetical protein